MDVVYSIDDDKLLSDEENSPSNQFENFPLVPFAIPGSGSFSFQVPTPRKKKKKRKKTHTLLDKSLIESIRPQLRFVDLEKVAGFLSPQVLTLHPGPDSNHPLDMYFEVHIHSLSLVSGFPYILSLVDFLNYYEIAPGQLIPNSH